MSKRVLITGGAGFIGSHLADELMEHGYRVRVLDNLAPQVHGENADWPDYLHPDVERVRGDVRNAIDLAAALDGIDAVYHFAAAVGVGQSMYEIAHYTSVNNMGAAMLLEALAERPVERLVVASSMSIYGEGLYRDASGAVGPVEERPVEQLCAHQWEVVDRNGAAMSPVPTPESKAPAPASVYALSKLDQERLCLMIGRASKIPTVALRFFNAYGPRQALSNPYTGVLAIFASRLQNNKPPVIFEDGLQTRDFVHVRDITQACRLAMESTRAVGSVFNIGSGRSHTVLDVARQITSVLNKSHIAPDVSSKYRVGDIRHCVADISRARELLKYQPRITLEEGLTELAHWLDGQVAEDRVAEAHAELERRRLSI